MKEPIRDSRHTFHNKEKRLIKTTLCDISHAGVREQLATVRLRRLISAHGKLTTRWADLKTVE